MFDFSKFFKCLIPCLFLFAAVATACDVPVFRYALERWERGVYRLLVVTPEALSVEPQGLVDQLNKHGFQSGGHTNLVVEIIDLSKTANEGFLEVFPEVDEISKPTALLLYPQDAYVPNIIFQEPFTKKTVDRLLQSPFLERLTHDILSGVSAVWVLMESGNQEADDAAYERLTAAVAYLKESVNIPAGVIERSGNITGSETDQVGGLHFDPENFLQSEIPLKIDFKVQRLSKDVLEPVFRSIVLHCEPGLSDFADQPMAFPVYGRGRFLQPLIGRDIQSQFIEMATTYICGACSCQIKAENPGLDFLSHIDWEKYLEGSEVVHDKELPPLMSAADLVDQESHPKPEGFELIAYPETQPALPGLSFSARMLVVLIIVLGLIVLVSLLIAKKK